MLGKTAGGLYWMFRYLERSENTARLVAAGQRIALTRSEAAEDEWGSVLTTAGVRRAYAQRYDKVDGSSVINFLLRDKTNPSSVLSVIESARNNARLVRTALTRDPDARFLLDRLRHTYERRLALTQRIALI